MLADILIKPLSAPDYKLYVQLLVLNRRDPCVGVLEIGVLMAEYCQVSSRQETAVSSIIFCLVCCGSAGDRKDGM